MDPSIKDYKILRTLDTGSSGVVLSAKEITTGKYVAIKAIKTSKETLLKDYKEASILSKLSSPDCHPNILCYYESFIDSYENGPALYIVTERFYGKTLTQYLEEQNNIQIVFPVLHKIYQQLIEGCRYIHSRGYAHCDIKPDNIMINERTLSVVYVDFGSACDGETCIGNRQRTVSYAAPEVFQQTAEYTLRGAQARDVWALGIVFYQLRLECPHPVLFPYDLEYSREEKIKKISNAPDFERHPLPDDGDACGFNDLIARMLVNNWNPRPTIFQVETDYNSLPEC